MSSHSRRAVVFYAVLAISGVAAGAMTPIPSHDTPAHRAALHFMRGVNFGNYLEYAAGDPAANATYTAKDFQLARAEGFDHIRLPVAWSLYCGPGPDFTIDPAAFNKADFLVGNATNQGLSIVVDLHHFTPFYGDPNGNTNQFYAIWRQVAAHYADAPPSVAFELLNEPNGAATTAIMNGVYATAIRQIRQTNPNRTIFVGPGAYNSLDELSKLNLSETETNLIATVHCYDPYYFTHQGAEWAYPDTKTTGVIFPGPPPTPLQPDSSITHDWVLTWFRQYNTFPTYSNPSSSAAFKARLQRAKTWADFYGRPVQVGEFGCYSKADPQSRVTFYRAIRETMDDSGLGWTMWDWKSGFHYIANGVPEPSGMREAMFPPLTLQSAPGGGFSCQAAVGKTFVVERANSLAAPITWEPISTQTLVSPLFTFSDPNTNSSKGYYRIQWRK